MRFTLLGALAVLATAIATPSSAAFLSIIEQDGANVTASGDCGFTCNDWGGLTSPIVAGPEGLSFSANIFNPNGGTGFESIIIDDPNGTLSDVLDLSWGEGTVSVVFCSETVSCDISEFQHTVFENGAGFVDFTAQLDPNIEIQVTSPEDVPEPITLSLFGAGLLGLGALRRRKPRTEA